jgi:hypothetical protein
VKTSFKYLRVILAVAIVVGVNLFTILKIRSAYTAYHWQSYALAYPLPGAKMQMLSQSGGSSYSVAVQGRYAYLGIGPRLEVLDLVNPSQPIRVWQSSILPGIVYDVTVSGHNLYLADSDGGLIIMDISNPIRPIIISFKKTVETAWNVAVSGQYAYLAAGSDGLVIYNVSDPTTPIEVGSYQPPAGDPWDQVGVRAVAISGTEAYLATLDDGLRVIDISDPTNPTEIGALSGSYKDVAVSGSSAYLVYSYGRGLVMADISTPADPIQQSYYYNELVFTSVAASGSLAYVSYGSCYEGASCSQSKPGMGMIDFSNPDQPQSLAFRELPANPQEITIIDSFAYIASGPSGLSIASWGGKAAQS